MKVLLTIVAGFICCVHVYSLELKEEFKFSPAPFEVPKEDIIGQPFYGYIDLGEIPMCAVKWKTTKKVLHGTETNFTTETKGSYSLGNVEYITLSSGEWPKEGESERAYEINYKIYASLWAKEKEDPIVADITVMCLYYWGQNGAPICKFALDCRHAAGWNLNKEDILHNNDKDPATKKSIPPFYKIIITPPPEENSSSANASKTK